MLPKRERSLQGRASGDAVLQQVLAEAVKALAELAEEAKRQKAEQEQQDDTAESS